MDLDVCRGAGISGDRQFCDCRRIAARDDPRGRGEQSLGAVLSGATVGSIDGVAGPWRSDAAIGLGGIDRCGDWGAVGDAEVRDRSIP